MDFLFKDSNNILLVSEAETKNIHKALLESQIGIGKEKVIDFLNEQQVEKVESGSYGGVFMAPYVVHTTNILCEILRILKPGGTFVLREPVVKESGSVEQFPFRTEKQLFLALTMAGFVNIQTKSHLNDDLIVNKIISSHTNQNLLRNNLSLVEITTNKPNFEIGTSSAIKLSKGKNLKEEKKPTVVWKLQNDDIEEEEEMEDEDSLLDESDLALPQKIKKDDCEIGKGGQKKACKNCTCGRKEEIASEPIPQTKSSCGSCYLGDAFRCSSCPYLGMPAFKSGEKVELSLDAVDV